MKMKCVLGALGAAMASFAAMAGESFAYQGVLQQSGKAVATKSVTIAFRLYGEATGGTALWARKINVRTDADGRFTTELSDSAGGPIDDLTNTVGQVLHDVTAADKALYIGLTVEGSTGEILPRQKIMPVPQASFARDALGTVGDSFTVESTLTASGGAVFEGAVQFSENVAFNQGATFAQEQTMDSAVISNVTQIAVGACCVMPIGSIVMWWGGETPPPGWAFVDGLNGTGKSSTPDLSGRFPMGMNPSYQWQGAESGKETVTLTIDEIPSHTHRFASDVNVHDDAGWPEAGEYKHTNGYTNDGDSKIKLYNTGYTGGGQAHNNMPPYLTVHYIMRVE